MASIEQSLRALRDVQGTHGSFVVTTTGALVARDLPIVFDGDLFSEVGPRVARLYDTLESGEEPMDACLLRFAEHKLYVRKLSSGIIGILSSVGINMPALRMVANLVIRRINDDVSRAAALVPPAQPIPLAPSGSAQSHGDALDTPASAGSVRNAPHNAFLAAGDRGSTPPSPTPPPVRPQDGRDPAATVSERHVRMYRGRRVD
jgi:predicted regulator of Ras-like GTPase activity (Roadblock/LC7/MglB family)